MRAPDLLANMPKRILRLSLVGDGPWTVYIYLCDGDRRVVRVSCIEGQRPVHDVAALILARAGMGDPEVRQHDDDRQSYLRIDAARGEILSVADRLGREEHPAATPWLLQEIAFELRSVADRLKTELNTHPGRPENERPSKSLDE